MTNEEYMRINRYLHEQGLCGRREADRLIEAGAVLVNGKRAVLGMKVSPNDSVTIKQSARISLEAARAYVLVNKPSGYVSHNPQKGEKEVLDLLPKSMQNLSPIGRLDKASMGLMLFSNDGRIVNKLLNPQANHEKEYVVTVDKKLTPPFQRAISDGVTIEGYKTMPAKIKKIDQCSFRLTLTEGKKHQIRRMCAALGYQVQALERVRIGTLKLGSLPRGKWRKLTDKEIRELTRS